MNISDVVKHYLLLFIVGAGAAVWGWLYFIKTKPGRAFWDARRIKLPVFGPIAHKICLARFTRTLSSLVRSGVPILEVLQIVSQTVGNVVMEKAIKTAATDIERGEGISAALGKNPIFPSMVIRMMSAGEQTGNIDNMLERVSNFLDEEIEATLSGLMSLIEPMLIVFLGIVIGGMVICMFLPIFNLANIVNMAAGTLNRFQNQNRRTKFTSSGGFAFATSHLRRFSRLRLENFDLRPARADLLLKPLPRHPSSPWPSKIARGETCPTNSSKSSRFACAVKSNSCKSHLRVTRPALGLKTKVSPCFAARNRPAGESGSA